MLDIIVKVISASLQKVPDTRQADPPGIYNVSIKRSGDRINLSLTSGGIFRGELLGKCLKVKYLNT